jgi:hypothetical protein
MASTTKRAAVDVFLLDLSATLQESERGAERIDRHLNAAQHTRATRGTLVIAASDVADVIAASASIVDESHRLVKNVRDARELLRQVQAECHKMRRGY